MAVDGEPVGVVEVLAEVQLRAGSAGCRDAPEAAVAFDRHAPARARGLPDGDRSGAERSHARLVGLARVEPLAGRDARVDRRLAVERLGPGLLLVDDHAAAGAVDRHVRRERAAGPGDLRSRRRAEHVVGAGARDAGRPEHARVAAVEDVDTAGHECGGVGEDGRDVIVADRGDQPPAPGRAVHRDLARRVGWEGRIVVDRRDAAGGERPVGRRAHAVVVEAALAEGDGRAGPAGGGDRDRVDAVAGLVDDDVGAVRLGGDRGCASPRGESSRPPAAAGEAQLPVTRLPHDRDRSVGGDRRRRAQPLRGERPRRAEMARSGGDRKAHALVRVDPGRCGGAPGVDGDARRGFEHARVHGVAGHAVIGGGRGPAQGGGQGEGDHGVRSVT